MGAPTAATNSAIDVGNDGEIEALAVYPGIEGIHYLKGSTAPYMSQWSPPDPQVAVGPSYVLETTNVLMAIYTKGGERMQSQALTSLLGLPASDRLTDPRVLYDGAAGRWLVSVSDETSNSLVLGGSLFANPQLPWRTQIFPATGCPDQPLLGTTTDKIVLSANDYTDCSTGGYSGAQYWVVNKAQFLAGQSASFRSWGPDGSTSSLFPVRNRDPLADAYLVSAGYNDTTSLRLIRLHGTPPNLVIPYDFAIPIRRTLEPRNAPQLGSPYQVNTGDSRVTDAELYANQLWVTLGDACTPLGAPTDRACIRVIQFDTFNGDRVWQDFDYGSVERDYFYPSLTDDGRGNLVVVFGFSSPGEFPGIMVAARSPGDPLGTLAVARVVHNGTGSEATWCPDLESCRYGDYFGAAVDPSTEGRVWVVGEYGDSSGWGTYVGSVRLYHQFRMTFHPMVDEATVGLAEPELEYTSLGQVITAGLGGATTLTMDTGTWWNVTDYLSVSLAGERWALATNATGIVTGGGDVILEYRHEFLLMVEAVPVEGGTVTPHAGWFVHGQAIALEAYPEPGWEFVGWSGTGVGAYGGGNPQGVAIASGPLVETAQFRPVPVYATAAFQASVLGVVGMLVVMLALVRSRRRKTQALPPPPAVLVYAPATPPPDGLPLPPPPEREIQRPEGGAAKGEEVGDDQPRG